MVKRSHLKINLEKRKKSPSFASSLFFSHFKKTLDQESQVEVVAPGFSCLKRELNQALLFLKNWGLRPKVPRDLFGKDLLCANTDSKRFYHLKRALEAKDSYVVFCLRGGYGSLRLLPFLESMKKPACPKLVVGYSDITSLHAFLNSAWKWPSLHAPHLTSLAKEVSQKDLKHLKQILFGERKEISFYGLKPLNASAKNKKIFPISSSLTGGNLRTLTSLIGTKWLRSLHSKIVVLEDIREEAYQVDRMLTQWEQAGLFRFIKALVFGDFLFEKPKDSFLTKKVIERFAKRQSFPVLSSLSFGHGRKKSPLPFGTKAELFFSSLSSKNVSSSQCVLRISCHF